MSSQTKKLRRHIVSTFYPFPWGHSRRTAKLMLQAELTSATSLQRELELGVPQLCWCYSQTFHKRQNISCACFQLKKLIWNSDFNPAAFCHLPVHSAFHQGWDHQSPLSASSSRGELSYFTHLSVLTPKPPPDWKEPEGNSSQPNSSLWNALCRFLYWL